MDLSYLDLDWRRMLVKHYKCYKLNEKELATLLSIYDIISSIDAIVTADDLVSYMTLPKEEIDKILSDLTEKRMIAYTTNANNKMVTSLQPLFDRIISDLKKDIVIETNQVDNQASKQTGDKLYHYFEEEMGRTLSGREIDRINTWVKTGSDERMIKEAVEKIKARSQKISIAAVDKVLLALQKNKDIISEGFSTRNEEWSKSSKETLDILSKNWVNKE